MEITYGTIMSWMKNIEMGFWRIDDMKNLSQNEIISKFNDLFKNELVRESTSDIAFNPYKGIGYMTVSYNKQDKVFIVNDNNSYMQCFYEGIFGLRDGKKLSFNKNLHGFYGDYFKYLEKENDDYVFVSSIIDGTCEPTPNIKRMINILFLRQQPICGDYRRKDVMFVDYSEAERREIIKECQRY